MVAHHQHTRSNCSLYKSVFPGFSTSKWTTLSILHKRAFLRFSSTSSDSFREPLPITFWIIMEDPINREFELSRWSNKLHMHIHHMVDQLALFPSDRLCRIQTPDLLDNRPRWDKTVWQIDRYKSERLKLVDLNLENLLWHLWTFIAFG